MLNLGKPAPTTKKENYNLYLAGKYGNMLQTWDTLDDYLASGFTGNVVIRYKQADFNKKFGVYDLKPEEVMPHIEKCIREGGSRDLFTLNEAAKDSGLTIQGELRQSDRHWELFYTHSPLPMRLGLEAEPNHAYGHRALAVLRKYLDDIDFDYLMEQFDTYSDTHAWSARNMTVEFSVWAEPVGTWHRRMVIWECRVY